MLRTTLINKNIYFLFLAVVNLLRKNTIKIP